MPSILMTTFKYLDPCLSQLIKYMQISEAKSVIYLLKIRIETEDVNYK